MCKKHWRKYKRNLYSIFRLTCKEIINEWDDYYGFVIIAQNGIEAYNQLIEEKDHDNNGYIHSLVNEMKNNFIKPTNVNCECIGFPNPKWFKEEIILSDFNAG